jgi:hypothetical protein
VELTLTVEISAVEFRRLNSFEWAVLSLLNTFRENTPTIADASIQLRIGEPAFLAAALENLRTVGAVLLRTSEPCRRDLNDYELSEAGKAILCDDGWENGAVENLTEDIALDWPSLTFHSVTSLRKHGERKQGGPSLDEVQEKLTLQKVGEWLNRNGSCCWRVKSFYVTNVES